MKRALAKLVLPVAFATILSGCATRGIPLPPSLELPKPVTDLRTMRKGDKVYLAWTIPSQTTDRKSVRYLGPTRVCRSLEATMTDCIAPVGEVAPPPLSAISEKDKSGKPSKIQASFTDTLPPKLEEGDPTAQIAYAVSVLNTRGRSAGLSNQVLVPAAPTVPPTVDFTAQVTAQGVLISWSCAPNIAGEGPVQYRIRVYRRTAGNQTETPVGEADPHDCSKPELLDQTAEWEKNNYYRANVVTVVSAPGKPEIEVQGDDTPVVQVFTHDIFPPAVPSGVQAVFSGVGQVPSVDLVWAPDTDADLAGYNIYRHEQGSEPMRINSELVKTPAFRDTNVISGKKYFYSVSAVDLRGNESVKSEETSEAVP
jgi:hypothetical protein